MADKEQDYRIFVGGLSWDVTERKLKDEFGRFGKVVDCQIVEMRWYGTWRNFWSIDISRTTEAQVECVSCL